ncbi:transcriptional regulator [Streptomyces spiroverticillatus]|uniref:Transcriptional regulator n=1 Tax=Streptomyces finlayi TaxID=67296 RepID=A0A918WU43_9ACTN|nr:helix-turn-helix transcriptional regulator [Streptomyces finlayi]GGZ98283.1 transcriptional regulator [Streptomyces spiroverticillatus]GHC83207.1 transcriptional regulator [Streptomyces finlayi]
MTVEDDGVDQDDPAASALAHFGNEARLERERLGITRADLGKAATCGYSLVAKIEKGQRVPPREFAEACDRLFPDAHGRFMRLWPLALKYAYPVWFRKYVALEETATHICMFNPHIVPGLLQTEAYAREVFRKARVTKIEDALTARLERQRILTREEGAPRLWIILDEAALRRRVGDAELMRGQLTRIRDVAETPEHVVQIIPASEGFYHAGGCPFSLLSFHDSADVVHVDGFPTGYIFAESDAVAESRHTYDLLKATALSADKSAAVIDSIMKDVYV